MFGGCIKIPAEDAIAYVGTYLVHVVDKTLPRYVIKEGTKVIGRAAFSGCKQVKSIVIPASIEVIEDYAFKDCQKLNSIEFLGDVPRISNNSIEGCNNLYSIEVKVRNISFKWWDFRNKPYDLEEYLIKGNSEDPKIVLQEYIESDSEPYVQLYDSEFANAGIEEIIEDDHTRQNKKKDNIVPKQKL